MRNIWYGVAFGLVAGLGLGWGLWKPRRIVETPAVEVRNKDSSLTLERRPDPSARPSHSTPSGVLERVVRITVKGDSFPVTDTLWLPAPKDSVPRGTPEPIIRTVLVDPPPLEIELSLVREGNQMRRVTASVKGGKVLGGIDIPVESATPLTLPRWAAGATYERESRTYGAFATRDIGPVRILLAADLPRANAGVTARVGVGLRW